LVFFSGSLFTYFYFKYRKYIKKKEFRKYADSISYKAEINQEHQVKNESSNIDKNQLTTSETSEEGLIREQLKRNYEFFGDEAMKKIIDSFVVVVGIGGVGR